MLKYINIGLRVLLVILGAVVAGLSAANAKHQVYASVPGPTAFGTFAGGFGITTSLIGLAAVLVTSIPGILLIVVDAASTLVYFAAGIVLAAHMRGVDCRTQDVDRGLLENPLFNGGTTTPGDRTCYGKDRTCYGIFDGYQREYDYDVLPELRSRCLRTQSDYAVMFIAAAFNAGVLALSFLRRRKEQHYSV